MSDFSFLKNIKKIDNRYQVIKENRSNFKIKYVINSHVDYMKEALSFMLPHAKAEIPKEDLLIVLGGGSSKDSFIDDGVEFQIVDYNAFDFHSFIHIVENPDNFGDYDYVFYMHDTCCPYIGFYNATYHIRQPGERAYAMSDAWSSNIGLYSIAWLMRNKNKLISMKKITPSQGTGYEDFLFKGTNAHKYSYNKRRTIYEKGCGDKLFHLGNTRKEDPVCSFKPNVFHPKDWNIAYKDVYHNKKYRRVIFWKNLCMAKFKSDPRKGGYDGKKN